MTLNSWSPCLSLLSVEITDVHPFAEVYTLLRIEPGLLVCWASTLSTLESLAPRRHLWIVVRWVTFRERLGGGETVTWKCSCRQLWNCRQGPSSDKLKENSVGLGPGWKWTGHTGRKEFLNFFFLTAWELCQDMQLGLEAAIKGQL